MHIGAWGWMGDATTCTPGCHKEYEYEPQLSVHLHDCMHVSVVVYMCTLGVL